jgi:outer membrane protein assembly factor BamB
MPSRSSPSATAGAAALAGVALAGVALALLLGGCAAVKDTWYGLTGGEENQEPPTEITEFTPLLKVSESWSRDVGDGTGKRILRLDPVVKDEIVYTADHTGTVTAVDAKTGKVRWDVDLKLPLTAGPGVGEINLVVGTGEGELLALDRAKGRLAWRLTVTSEVLAPPVVGHGTVIARTGDGKVFAIDEKDGRRLWSYDRGIPLLTLHGTSTPLMDEDTIYIGLDNGRMVALERESGRLLWEAVVAAPTGRTDLERMVDIDGDPVLDHGTLYVATYRGKLAAISAADGAVDWSRDISSYAGLAVDGEQIYLADDLSRIWAMERNSGKPLWRQEKLKGRQITAPIRVGEYLLVGDLEGYVHWIRARDGRLVARERAGKQPIIANPLPHGESGAIVYGSGGELAAFQWRLIAGAEAQADLEETKKELQKAKERLEKEKEDKKGKDGKGKDDGKSKAESAAMNGTAAMDKEGLSQDLAKEKEAKDAAAKDKAWYKSGAKTSLPDRPAPDKALDKKAPPPDEKTDKPTGDKATDKATDKIVDKTTDKAAGKAVAPRDGGTTGKGGTGLEERRKANDPLLRPLPGDEDEGDAPLLGKPKRGTGADNPFGSVLGR